jgi:hypothetical protein
MRLERLLDFGFTLNPERTSYLLERGTLTISIGVDELVSTSREGDYEAVEVSFIENGKYLSPPELPLDFPFWNGSFFPFTPVEYLCALLPIFCPSFTYSAGMRVRDHEGQKYTIRGRESRDSYKLDGINENGSYRVLDKRDITLISLGD